MSLLPINILTINGGSSSIKFAVYETGGIPGAPAILSPVSAVHRLLSEEPETK